MTEETFARELERHADRVHGAPLSFTDVRGRARQIRRRRRATAAAAVAAAVAVVAVVPAVLSGKLDRADAPQPAPAPTRSAHTAVLHDGEVSLPDGRTVRLDVDNADVQQLGLLTDGRIVVALSKPFAVRVYAADGTLAKQYAVQSNAITMSAGDDAVAWVAKDFTVRVLASGEAEPAELPGIPMPGEAVGSIDAVLDAQHLLVGDGTTTGDELTAGGVERLSTPEPLRVQDVSPSGELWAVDLPGTGTDPQFGCSGLYDPAQGQLVAKNCNFGGNLKFSPDGEFLAGAEGDNNMFGEVQVFDLGLERVGTWQQPGSQVVSRYAWADATHLLAATVGLKDNRWSLARVALDFGDPEIVAGPVTGRNPEIVSEFLPSE